MAVVRDRIKRDVTEKHRDQDVTNIGSPQELLRYAMAGQLAQLQARRPDVNQGKIAHAALGGDPRGAASKLSHALATGPTADQLRNLDEILAALDPNSESTGGLCSLALRLAEEDRGRQQIKDSLTAHVPPSWTPKLLKAPEPSELGVLIQASALLSAFRSADKTDTPSRSIGDIRNRFADEMDLLVRRLILIAVGPPTPRNIDAQVMLGSLASYSYEPMKEHLEYALRSTPLGFRVWRAITKLVKLSPEESGHSEALKGWVRDLILDSEELRENSLYPGRSLDLELAITIPASWSPPTGDWVGQALLRRARNERATIRERGTAAMGLWERAFTEQRPDLETTKKQLRELIDEFNDGDARPDAAAGLRWVATTLKHVIDTEEAVCNVWPEVGEADKPWFSRVQAVANELENNSVIPAYLRTGTATLFRHMILQNAGVYRRQAIETVATSGWGEPVTRALGRLLREEQEESWIRIRALFALGFLQRRDRTVEADLIRACQHAYENLKVAEPLRAHITEMHTALSAVGDCFGALGAEERAKGAREALRPMLTELADSKDRAESLHRAARAAAYLLFVTAQPREGGKKDLSEELLEKFRDYPDEVTSRLSKWALSFRFADDGALRPLLAAVDYELAGAPLI